MLTWFLYWLAKFEAAEAKIVRDPEQLIRIAKGIHMRKSYGELRPDEPFEMKVSKAEFDALRDALLAQHEWAPFDPPIEAWYQRAELHGVPLRIV